MFKHVLNCGHYPVIQKPENEEEARQRQEEWAWYLTFITVSSGAFHDQVPVYSDWWCDGQLALTQEEAELIRYTMDKRGPLHSLTAKAVAQAEDWRMHARPELRLMAANWREHLERNYVRREKVAEVHETLGRVLRGEPEPRRL